MRPPETPLADRVALVTGGSGGIGAETAVALAAAGARVVLIGRSEPVRTLDRLRGREAIHLPCDVGDWPAARTAVETALGLYGRVDILINNAGVIDPIGRLGETRPEAWARNVITNLIGPYNMARAAIAALVASRGAIVNLSSGAAHAPREGWTAYCSGKAGLAMLTRGLHLEYGPLGVRVFGLQPGVVDTAMQVRIRASGINEISRIPRAALASPEVPARAVLRLCLEGAEALRGRDFTLSDPDFLSLMPRHERA